VETKQTLDERFVEALKANRGAMFRVAYMMLRSAADAEDAVSTATLSAYRSILRIRNWDVVRAYLVRITVNTCHNTLRKRKREIAVETDILCETQIAPEETPIWMYTQQLPLQMRIVLQMRYGEDMRLEDIAVVLRIPKGTVSSRLTRAQAMLRQLMEKEG
jgi:RNA polymerase sigma-70 factor (ECF subfamily)